MVRVTKGYKPTARELSAYVIISRERCAMWLTFGNDHNGNMGVDQAHFQHYTVFVFYLSLNQCSTYTIYEGSLLCRLHCYTACLTKT